MEFLEQIRKGVESTKVINKNIRSLLAMTFEFSRISKTNLTSVDYLKRHFVFFWKRPLIVDIPSVLGAEIYTLPR